MAFLPARGIRDRRAADRLLRARAGGPSFTFGREAAFPNDARSAAAPFAIAATARARCPRWSTGSTTYRRCEFAHFSRLITWPWAYRARVGSACAVKAWASVGVRAQRRSEALHAGKRLAFLQTHSPRHASRVTLFLARPATGPDSVRITGVTAPAPPRTYYELASPTAGSSSRSNTTAAAMRHQLVTPR